MEAEVFDTELENVDEDDDELTTVLVRDIARERVAELVLVLVLDTVAVSVAVKTRGTQASSVDGSISPPSPPKQELPAETVMTGKVWPFEGQKR